MGLPELFKSHISEVIDFHGEGVGIVLVMGVNFGLVDLEGFESGKFFFKSLVVLFKSLLESEEVGVDWVGSHVFSQGLGKRFREIGMFDLLFFISEIGRS